MLKNAKDYQGQWSLTRKGAHLHTQYIRLMLRKGTFCAPKFWPQLSNCASNFEQVPPPLFTLLRTIPSFTIHPDLSFEIPPVPMALCRHEGIGGGKSNFYAYKVNGLYLARHPFLDISDK